MSGESGPAGGPYARVEVDMTPAGPRVVNVTSTPEQIAAFVDERVEQTRCKVEELRSVYAEMIELRTAQVSSLRASRDAAAIGPERFVLTVRCQLAEGALRNATAGQEQLSAWASGVRPLARVKVEPRPLRVPGDDGRDDAPELVPFDPVA